ncbi:hypothetical protein TGARI_372700 [Toxoplasma gondii ARI]|uniref:Uncharacterized protein n=1 Tax=Toxoplasma gondii ARI TaxID=1074872 RepID=A0A139XI61_TOXGO|nr:hypothetical protein TGARI_372700 [Toxoplasma gondii ARI]
MGERLLIVCRCAVCLRDCLAYSSGGGGARQRSDGTLARFVDVLGVAALHGSAGTWKECRRVHARMCETLLAVCLCAVCLRDGCGCCSEADSKRRNGRTGVFCISRQLPHHVETIADEVTAMRCC